MAKDSRTVTYKNCTINLTDMTITEYTKDDYDVFKIIEDVFKSWNGIDGVDITIKKANEITSGSDDGSDEGKDE